MEQRQGPMTSTGSLFTDSAASVCRGLSGQARRDAGRAVRRGARPAVGVQPHAQAAPPRPLELARPLPGRRHEPRRQQLLLQPAVAGSLGGGRAGADGHAPQRLRRDGRPAPRRGRIYRSARRPLRHQGRSGQSAADEHRRGGGGTGLGALPRDLLHAAGARGHGAGGDHCAAQFRERSGGRTLRQQPGGRLADRRTLQGHGLDRRHAARRRRLCKRSSSRLRLSPKPPNKEAAAHRRSIHEPTRGCTSWRCGCAPRGWTRTRTRRWSGARRWCKRSRRTRSPSTATVRAGRSSSGIGVWRIVSR